MGVHYLYEKSPKKCHELESVVVELKACLTKKEMPTKHSYRSVRACGTRFVCQSCCS